MICAAVSHITNSILFDSAYPATEKVEFEIYHRDAFVKCAKELKLFEIVTRIRHNAELVKLCTRVVNILIISVLFDLLIFFLD